jgi:hypothetical protein
MLSGNALVLDVQSTTARSNVSWIEPHANSGILEFGIAAAEILRFKFGARRHQRGVRTTARSLGSPRPEGLPQLLGEERRLLERGEMAAFVEFIPIK